MNYKSEKTFSFLKKILFCPICGEIIVRFNRGFGCKNTHCSFFIPREIRQRILVENTVSDLIQNGKTSIIHGFHKKGSSQTFSAQLLLTKSNKIKIELPASPLFKCPKCNASLIYFQNGYKCSREDDCGFILWHRFAGKELTKDQLIGLLTNKQTEIIKGFISKKNGKRYSARIILNKIGELRLEFV